MSLIRRQAASTRAVAIAPATTSEWPFRYLVAECTTRSHPKSRGLQRTGVATVESAQTIAPARWARSHTASMSVIVQSGLLGVSIHTSPVLPRVIAERHAP